MHIDRDDLVTLAAAARCYAQLLNPKSAEVERLLSAAANAIKEAGPKP